MDKLKNMQLFCRVVELGSFAKTAQDMDVTPAIVGRRIAQLEEALGVRLIKRTTRSMEVTQAGQDYYQGCKAISEQVAVLEQSLLESTSHEPCGVIRVATPDGFAAPYLLDLLVDFQASYPQVHVDIVTDNSRSDLVKDNIDVAIRFAIELEDASYVAYPLRQTRLALVASADYLEQRGRPQSLADLQDHDCLLFGASRYGAYWPVLQQGQAIKIKQPWKLSFVNSHVYVDALDRGLGIGLLPELFLDGLSQGPLQVIEGLCDFHSITIYAVYPGKDYLPERVRVFLEYLKAAYA